MTGTIAITVVTPVHGRTEMVARLLASLARAQERYAGAADVLLVDSSPPPAADSIAALAAAHGACVVRAPNDVRLKRNLGVRHAGGDVVLFVDSDCVADPNLLAEHAAGHAVARAPDGRPVAGVLGLVRTEGPETPAWRAAEAAGFCDSFAFAARWPQADWGPCANLSLRRDVLVALGGFREDWPGRLGGDDVELGLRVTGSGRAILCRPGAVVAHDRATWARWGAVGERARRWGAMDVHVRAAMAAARLVPTGPGPAALLAVATALAATRAARLRRPRAMARAALAVPAALALAAPERGAAGARAGGAALRVVFDLGTLAEAIRIGRPGLAFVALHPPDRPAARRRAMRRTAVATALLVALKPLLAPRARPGAGAALLRRYAPHRVGRQPRRRERG